MRIIDKILLLTIIFSTCSCGAGAGDDAVDLGGGYVYRSDGNLRWIYSSESYFENGVAGNVNNYNYDDNFIIVSQIPSKYYYKWRFTDDLIYKYKTIAHDTNFVENKDVHKKHFIQSTWWADTITRKKIYASLLNDKEYRNEAVRGIVDSLLANNGYYRRMFGRKINFWIIIKHKYEVIGPMDKSKFEAERRRLGIVVNFKKDEE